MVFISSAAFAEVKPNEQDVKKPEAEKVQQSSDKHKPLHTYFLDRRPYTAPKK